MGGTDQHGEPVRGASSFVAGRRVPAGYAGVEGAPPPPGVPHAG